MQEYHSNLRGLEWNFTDIHVSFDTPLHVIERLLRQGYLIRINDDTLYVVDGVAFLNGFPKSFNPHIIWGQLREGCGDTPFYVYAPKKKLWFVRAAMWLADQIQGR